MLSPVSVVFQCPRSKGSGCRRFAKWSLQLIHLSVAVETMVLIEPCTPFNGRIHVVLDV